jgi:hypothetical protein
VRGEKGRAIMLTPARKSPDERGQRWLQDQVQQILAAGAVALAPPRSASDPSCYWGTEPETTLSMLLAGDPEPKMLRVNPALLHDCSAGRYARQQQAVTFMRRTLKKTLLLDSGVL